MGYQVLQIPLSFPQSGVKLEERQEQSVAPAPRPYSVLSTPYGVRYLVGGQP